MQGWRQSGGERFCRWEGREACTKHCPLTPRKSTAGEYTGAAHGGQV